MRILAIDPGPEQSAYCLWDGFCHTSGIVTNNEMLYHLDEDISLLADHLFIEEIASYGMAVGRETFRTCFWYGRFAEAWHRLPFGGEAILIERRLIKMHHCHSARATDANIRQALIDRFGAPGTKREPGVLFGVKSHMWAALALAVYAHDIRTAAIRESA
jgi:hypothetical protein